MPRPLLVRSSNDFEGQFSPDGRWVAYVSDESGRYEVYVGRYPDFANRVAISTDGGLYPRWSRNERELFYRQGDALMAVTVDTKQGFRAEKPRRLFAGPRYWRTRKDAFAEVWEQLKEQLEQHPDRETKQLLQQLQRRYPGQFKDGQLRTLQRRVRAWREVRSVYCEGVLLPAPLMDQSSVGPSRSQGCDGGSQVSATVL